MNKTVIAGEHGLGDSKPGGLSRVGFCSNLSMSVATATDSKEHEQVVSYEQEYQRLIASNAANSVKNRFYEKVESSMRRLHRDIVTRCSCTFAPQSTPKRAYIHKHWKVVHDYRLKIICVKYRETYDNLFSVPSRHKKRGPAWSTETEMVKNSRTVYTGNG